MYQLRAQKRLAAHERQYSAGGGVQPVNRGLFGLFTQAFYAVVERPTIMTIEIALPLSKKIGNDRMKGPRQNSGLDIREKPPVHRSENKGGGPAPLTGASQGEVLLVIVILGQQCRMLGKNRLGEFVIAIPG